MSYTRQEKLDIVLSITNKLIHFEGKDGQIINLFNESYSFVPKIKTIFNDYINGEKEYRGVVEFEEIGKKIEYRFPIYKKYNPLFVIKM